MGNMRNSKGQFEKGNKAGFVASGDKPLTAHIGLKLTEGDKEALKKIPEWRKLLRECVRELIEEHSE